MSRFLFATWDGAGNLVPTLGLAARLVARGHDVRVLGHAAIEKRCRSGGWRFRSLVHVPGVDSAAARDGADDMHAMARRIWFNAAAIDDIREEMAREETDVLIADCMLWGALSAGTAASVPTVALFHGALTPFRRGPFADLLDTFVPALNAMRGSLGLRPVSRASDAHDACTLSVVAVPREFEPPAVLPENVRFMGPLLDGTLLSRQVATIGALHDGAPLVVISFSTSDQGQLPILQRVIDALTTMRARIVVTTGPAVDPSSLRSNGRAEVVRFVPHDQLFPRASLVVTHAGLGTVMTALAHGRPVLAIPLGRDQWFNASRVEALGAGRLLRPDCDGEGIARAVGALLGDTDAMAAARRVSDLIAGYAGGEAAIMELEAVAARAQV